MNAALRPSALSSRPLTIGQLAKAAGVGVETVRFYERRGLLTPPARRPSGYRSYGDEAVAQLGFIRRAKDLGFTLREIQSLLDLRRDPAATSAEVREQAKLKIEDIDSRIQQLQEIRSALQHLIHRCRGRGPLSDCPIVDAMEHGERRPSGLKGGKR